ncbi:prephenate dehydrogenase, partial [Streptomyces sp. SBT349]|uniref:prephenate dehydrogenase n=1 Tax=Streptomyces sp. SBT349 TaxID=1580539 RepID=UPI001F289990
VALALSRHGVTVHLDDADPAAARTAEAMGAGSVGPPKEPVDLAVLAVPPAHIGTVLARSQRSGLARAYTDVASVKARPQDQIRSAGGDLSSYVGGHPLAGSERSGPLAARPDLFEGRTWVLTPSVRTDRAALNCGLELVSLCGAVPMVMDSVRHDRAVALTSHAPHLISALVAARLAPAEEEHLRISGQGLRDVSRVAAGDPTLWGDILDANADAVADVLEAFADDLGRAIDALRALRGTEGPASKQGAAFLDELLRLGNRGHARVPRKGGAGPAVYVPLPVVIPDQPGSLARLFAAVGEAGVNIEDLRIEHAVDQPRGLVELLVEESAAPGLRRVLRADGWIMRDADIS